MPRSVLAILIWGVMSTAYAQERDADKFAMARIRWTGGWRASDLWSHDYPVAEYNLMRQLRLVTAVATTEKVEIFELMDPELFRYPFAYMCEVQQCILSDEEAKGLREYLLRGGFVMVDDSWFDMGHFLSQLKKVFPDRPVERITSDHPVFHAFYDIYEIPAIRAGRRWGGGPPVCYGISDDSGRLMMLINWNNDVGDGWEWANFDRYSAVDAYKLGINYILYALSH